MENAAQAPDIIQPAMEEIPDIVQPELSRLSPEEAGEGKFKKLLSVTRNIGHLATRGSQTALVLLQVSPANEVVRFGAFGAGEAMTHSPVMGALTYGLSTLGVEVAGTLAGAPLLDTGPSERITNFLNRKLSRVTADRESEQREYSRTTKLSTAFIGGTVPAMALEKLEDPTRTPEHNRRFGLWTSAWLAGACAVQGAAMSEGIDLASNNTKLAAGAAGVAAAGAAGGWLKRRLRKNNEAAEYGLYESLLSENTKKYAQQQGLDQEEFASALKDSETARAVVSDGKHEIPLLVPLKHMKWLNEDFYARHFPNEHDAGTLKLLNSHLELETSEQLKQSLKDLAEKNGVIVFDYPEADTGYVANLEKLLHDLGIKVDEAQELGTQTYYAGKVKLKRPHHKREHPESLIATFEEMVEDGSYDQRQLADGASLQAQVSEDVAQDMGELYSAAFEVLNNHPCRQGLIPNEFFDMATKDKEVAKIICSQNGVVESMCMLAEDLSKFKWINPDYYKDRFPDEFAQHQIAYFPAIATAPSKQGQRNSEAMVDLIAQICEAGDNEIVVAFDSCDMNKGFLNKFLEQIINKTPEASIHFSELDTQHYSALRLSLM